MPNSRTKGAGGEREFAAAVNDMYGVKLRRNLEQVRGGGHDFLVDDECTGDVADWLMRHAVEVKRYRAVTPALIGQWWAQTLSQAAQANLRPLLAYRGDRQPWCVVLALNELVDGTESTFTIALDGIQALAGKDQDPKLSDCP